MTVQVIEGDGLLVSQSPGGSPIEPYVILTIEGQQIQTKEALSSQDMEWNEWFTFEIGTG